MDGVRICVALAPLALYLAFIASLNLRRRPAMLSGGWDWTALGFGLSGMVLVGPIELLHPYAAVNILGLYIWVLSVAFYVLLVSLVVLMSKPRLTVYNISVEELRPLLAQVIDGLDPQHRWAGSCLSLPNLNVQLFLETNTLMRNVALVAAGDRQCHMGWRQLERALSQQLTPVRARVNVWGVGLSMAALTIAAVTAWFAQQNHQMIVATFREILPF
jgi:hypothetical protein